MKQPPGENRSDFQASKFSGEGFLGSDRRSVDEIIVADARALDGAGIERRAVRGEFHESMGRIPCPFKGCGVFEKGEAAIADAESKVSLNVTDLGIHLIRKHGFFQGRGSRFRIDPLEAARILRVKERP
jgi:hypothetical protein